MGIADKFPTRGIFTHKASLKGDSYATYLLEGLYAEGKGVAEDGKRAAVLHCNVLNEITCSARGRIICRMWEARPTLLDDVCFELGRLYALGARDVPQDGEKAIAVFQRGYDGSTSNSKRALELARSYAEGRVGVGTDWAYVLHLYGAVLGDGG